MKSGTQANRPPLDPRENGGPIASVSSNGQCPRCKNSVWVISHQIVLASIQLTGFDQFDGVVISCMFPEAKLSKPVTEVSKSVTVFLSRSGFWFYALIISNVLKFQFTYAYLHLLTPSLVRDMFF